MICPVPPAPSKTPSEVLKCTVALWLGDPPSVTTAVTVALVSPSPGSGLGVADSVMAAVVEHATHASARNPKRSGRIGAQTYRAAHLVGIGRCTDDAAQSRRGLSLQAPPRGARAGLARNASHAPAAPVAGRHRDPRRRGGLEAGCAPRAGGDDGFLRAGGRRPPRLRVHRRVQRALRRLRDGWKAALRAHPGRLAAVATV